MRLRFIPLDDRAKDTAYHLLRTDPADRRERAEYCARWNPELQQFELSCGCPIPAEATHFARRAPAPAPAAKPAPKPEPAHEREKEPA